MRLDACRIASDLPPHTKINLEEVLDRRGGKRWRFSLLMVE